jgi:uncharacterized damage-inducible protein DinB
MNILKMKNTELLIYMLEDIREVTIKGISGLTKEQLFQEPVPGEFPIGAYIMHLGEADLGWLSSLKGEEQPEELKKRCYYNSWFDVDKADYNPPTEPIEPEEYINAITEPRKILINYIRNMSDEDLQVTVKRKRRADVEVELSKKWMIYHLIEHEAHTRGQMFMLIRMAGFKKKGENN